MLRATRQLLRGVSPVLGENHGRGKYVRIYYYDIPRRPRRVHIYAYKICICVCVLTTRSSYYNNVRDERVGRASGAYKILSCYIYVCACVDESETVDRGDERFKIMNGNSAAYFQTSRREHIICARTRTAAAARPSPKENV